MTKVLINENLVKGFCADDREEFTKLLRLEPEQLNFILGKIMLQIARKDRTFRKGISPAERLAITLGFLACCSDCGIGRCREEPLSDYHGSLHRQLVEPAKSHSSNTLHESHRLAHRGNIAGVLTSAVEEWRLQRPHGLQPLCSHSAANMAVAVEHAKMSPYIKCFAHAIIIAAQNPMLKINKVQ